MAPLVLIQSSDCFLNVRNRLDTCNTYGFIVREITRARVSQHIRVELFNFQRVYVNSTDYLPWAFFFLLQYKFLNIHFFSVRFFRLIVREIQKFTSLTRVKKKKKNQMRM